MELRTKYFDMYYDKVDETIIHDVVQNIDSTFEKVTGDFQINPRDERYSFYLCRDVKEYIVRTGKKEEDYQNWMVGWADYKLKKLCILSPRVVVDRTPKEMRKVITHEIVHITLASLENPDETNIFLAEGIAVAYANQIESEYLMLDNYPSVSDIWDEDGFYENNGYNYSGVYVKYLIELIGIEQFKGIYVGKTDISKYLYSTFEYDAIRSYLEYKCKF